MKHLQGIDHIDLMCHCTDLMCHYTELLRHTCRVISHIHTNLSTVQTQYNFLGDKCLGTPPDNLTSIVQVRNMKKDACR